jgi:hypothetical protein
MDQPPHDKLPLGEAPSVEELNEYFITKPNYQRANSDDIQFFYKMQRKKQFWANFRLVCIAVISILVGLVIGSFF